MVITESKALSLVSNAELVAKIPALSALHQAYIRAKTRGPRGSGCGRCGKSNPALAPIKRQAVDKLRTLPSEDIEKLKSHLVTKDLVFYINNGSGAQKILR